MKSSYNSNVVIRHFDRQAIANVTLCIFVVIIACIFVSNDSFWIDEGNTAYKASRATLNAWFLAMHLVPGSDSQMPGYMLYIWAWEKVVPHSEFFLRLSNLPWMLVLAFALRRFRFALLFAFTSPFILSYLSELRPYLMQLAGAALTVRGFSELDSKQSKAWITVLSGCLVMCLASLIGVVWSMGALIYVIAHTPRILRNSEFWKGIVFFTPAYTPLAAYYAWTLAGGKQAAMMGGGLLTSLGAASYELLGLAGLGPGKIELRTHPGAVWDYAFFITPALLAISSLMLIGLIKHLKTTPRPKLVATTAGIAVPLIILLSLVVLKDFRLLGRHLVPLEILMILLCGTGTSTAAFGIVRQFGPWYKRIGSLLPLLVIACGLASGLSLRFAQRHRKDDYREAARIARQAMTEGRPVIWIADRCTGYFYGLNEQHVGWQPWRQNMPVPILMGNECVLLNKPDIYDSKASFAELLKTHQFKPIAELTAFTIFERNLIYPSLR
ncbi:MAG: hypothetical protein WCO57_03380 [Verrucomicrobiota bacterium]